MFIHQFRLLQTSQIISDMFIVTSIVYSLLQKKSANKHAHLHTHMHPHDERLTSLTSLAPRPPHRSNPSLPGDMQQTVPQYPLHRPPPSPGLEHFWWMLSQPPILMLLLRLKNISLSNKLGWWTEVLKTRRGERKWRAVATGISSIQPLLRPQHGSRWTNSCW